ncbi:hypothetical protein SETIT_3G360500v2 [Setaria italica]|uniref:Uncharacterized protein n=1 Tax=Setaria italica TaxID=4555 RepID=A0A368QMN3_SETIT|nr:hypothetical protein SETIT_3G360500v2 [Setaria italica]
MRMCGIRITNLGLKSKHGYNEHQVLPPSKTSASYAVGPSRSDSAKVPWKSCSTSSVREELAVNCDASFLRLTRSLISSPTGLHETANGRCFKAIALRNNLWLLSISEKHVLVLLIGF